MDTNYRYFRSILLLLLAVGLDYIINLTFGLGCSALHVLFKIGHFYLVLTNPIWLAT